MSESGDKPIREAASVILTRTREGSGGQVEVFLLRRHRKASFMSSAFVFPGGTADPGETDPRVTAARELFEEAGVLIAEPVPEATTLARWRDAVNAGERALGDILAEANTKLAVERMAYYAHWITPSVERKRFSARFFLAELPAGQTPSFDNKETVDEIWVTPDEALERAGELRLPPPQVRTFIEMREAAAAGMSALFADATRRAENPHPILPRLRPLDGGGFALLLPWDPEYATAGTGDAREMPSDHPLATGHSRFVLEDMTWKNIPAPPSPTEV